MTARIITTLGQKGGVGKSSVARMLAVYGTLCGWETRLCDLDPAQGTASTWKGARDAGEIEPDVAVEKCRTVEAALRYRDLVKLLILDTPAFLDKRGLDAAKASNLVVIPSGLGLDDLAPQVEAGYELLDKGLDQSDIVFVLARARNGSEARAAVKYLRPTGFKVMSPVMRELPSIRQAHSAGRCAFETGYDTVDGDMRHLAANILKLIA